MAAELKYIGDVSVRWLLSSKCFLFSVSVTIGRSGTHNAIAEVEAHEILAAADQLKASDQTTWTLQYLAGTRQVPIHVPRETVVEIAQAIDGAHDLDDVGHLFWHYCYPDTHKPCSSCYETVAAAEAVAALVAIIHCVIPIAAGAQHMLARAEAAEAWVAQFGPFKKRAADTLADEVAVLIRHKVISMRSPVADALLDYRNPPATERADRMAALEAANATLTTMREAIRRLIADAVYFAPSTVTVAELEAVLEGKSR